MSTFTQVDANLFSWTDTCNVYVLRDGDAALLIDLGDGSVLEHLNDIGVKNIEWVLFTHHHREQCQGAAKLEEWRKRGAKVGVPEVERAFFEKPLSFRKMRPTLNDAFSVYGASYVRPPLSPIAADRTFARMDDFTWRAREFWCVHSGGHSPGMMSYLLKTNGKWIAFSGDLMCAGAKMHTWFDSEFDYGFAKGLYELGNSAAQIAGYAPALFLPSHGPAVSDAKQMLQDYVKKLRNLGELYVRGYDIFHFAGCDQDNVSQPTGIPHLWNVLPHLYKFRGPDYWVNFTMILADNGHALLIDCGLFNRAFLDKAFERMKERLGLKAIDAIFVTHMHGDHALDSEYVRQKYGAKLWTLECVAPLFERPWDFDLAALLPAYSDTLPAPGPLKFDQVLRDGETIIWEGYSLTADWMPGQTKFHACLHGQIDGKSVAFTGDNIFASTVDIKQGGNEAVVAKNGGALEEGYLYAADYLHGLGPDLIMGGHCWALNDPMALIGRLRTRALALRDAFSALSIDDDYRYMFDPYWVQAIPYRTTLKPGEEAEISIRVRNFNACAQTHRIEIATPPGLTAAPAVLEDKVPGEAILSVPVNIRAAMDAKPGLQLIAFDITRDGVRHGQLFDAIIHVGAFVGTESQPKTPAAKTGY